MHDKPKPTVAKARMAALQEALSLAKSPSDRAAIKQRIEHIASYHALTARFNALHPRVRFSVDDEGAVDIFWGDHAPPSDETFAALSKARALSRALGLNGQE